MILIFSQFQDSSTTNVIRWLHKFGVRNVLRINEDDVEAGAPWIDLRNESFVIHACGKTFSSKDIQATWFRKGTSWLGGMFREVNIHDHPWLSDKLNKRFAMESRKAREYFHYLVKKNCRMLGNPATSNPNKMILMHMASESGLDVPDLLISNNAERFSEWSRENGGQIVTKAMSDCLYLWDSESSGNGYFSYTERSNLPLSGDVHGHLPLSIVQREIEKKFEVRSFYLDGEFFSVAIFSQLDTKTTVDYRKYNHERPNRNIPFQLPKSVEQKLRTLFDRLDLNTGSVDLIVDNNDRYVFLEVNPCGQYGGLSVYGNYHLDMKIASWLANLNGHDTTQVTA